MTSRTEAVTAAYADIADWQEELYRDLHAHPELSGQEERTRAEVQERLESFGYDVQEVGGGVVGVLRNGDGPTVLVRADMDGLPVQERTDLPYASTDTQTTADGEQVPVMHACGHDSHVAAGLGAAALLAQGTDHWSGTYIALFQPAEEVLAGSQQMIDDDLVDTVPSPDVCLAQHIQPYPDAGMVGVRPGPMLAGARSLRITLHGSGSHGGMPHLGIDAIVLGAHLVTRLQSVVSREVPPGEVGVISVGSFQAGNSPNVLADRAVLQLTLRAYSDERIEMLHQAVARVVAAECQASGAPEAEIEVLSQAPATVNDEETAARVEQAFTEHFGEDRVVPQRLMAASEDFSRIPAAFGVPYCYWTFGGFEAGSQTYANHSPFFAPVLQPTLATATEAAVVAALTFLD